MDGSSENNHCASCMCSVHVCVGEVGVPVCVCVCVHVCIMCAYVHACVCVLT